MPSLVVRNLVLFIIVIAVVVDDVFSLQVKNSRLVIKKKKSELTIALIVNKSSSFF